MVNSAADRLGVLKIRLNNILRRNRFAGNEYQIFFVLPETMTGHFGEGAVDIL